MDATLIEEFFKFSKRRFFTDVFLLCCIFIGIIACVRYYKKTKIHSAITIYTIYIFFAIIIAEVLVFRMNEHNSFDFKLKILLLNNVLSAVEYYTFYLFFSGILYSSLYKKLLLYSVFIIVPTSIILSIAIFLSNDLYHIELISYMLNLIEFILLLLYSLRSFLELNKHGSNISLNNSPSFWINSGLLIYIASSIPLLSSGYGLNKELYRFLFSLHYFSFGIFFLTISKALTFKKSLTE